MSKKVEQFVLKMVKDYNYYARAINLERNNPKLFERYAGKITTIRDYLDGMYTLFNIKV